MQEPQNNQTPITNSEEQKPEGIGERPTWLPENFKTPEDLAKSYQELEKKLGENGNELGLYRKAFENLQSAGVQFDQNGNPILPKTGSAAQVADQEPQYDYEDPGGSISKMLDHKLEVGFKRIENQLTPMVGIVSDTAVSQVESRLEAQYGQFPPEVKQYVRKLAGDLESNQRTNPAIIENLFRMAIGDYALQGGKPAPPMPQPQPQPAARPWNVVGPWTQTQGQSSAGAGIGEEDSVGADESYYMKQFGMTEKEWKEQQAAIERDRVEAMKRRQR